MDCDCNGHYGPNGQDFGWHTSWCAWHTANPTVPLVDVAAAPQSREVERLHRVIDKLLAHCPEGECDECSRSVCPDGDPNHFHHDGCPSCAEQLS